MIAIDIRGLEDVQRQLQRLAEAQLPFAMAGALNDTAFAVQRMEKQRLPTVFDRPTPLITSSVKVGKATKHNLTAVVYIDPKRVVMGPHEHGGPRGAKQLEVALRAKGWLPSGYRAVPSESMALDAYGNPSRAEVNRMLKGLQGAVGFGWRRTKTQRYFCIPVGGTARLSPGLWLEAVGSSGKGAGGYRMRKAIPLFLFVSGVRYSSRLGFVESARVEAVRLLPELAARAVQRAIDTAR